MRYQTNLQNVKVGQVGQFLVREGDKFKVIDARLISETEVEKVITSKVYISEVKMLPTMTRQNITTLSLDETKAVIEFVKKHGCKKGTECHVETTLSSGARYTKEEAEELGEGIGWHKDSKGAIVYNVMPKDERVKRGLERTVHCIMVFDGEGEKDLYNSNKYHSEAVIDSLAK